MLDFIQNLLAIPLKFMTFLVSFLSSILTFLMYCVCFIWNFLTMSVNILPDFVVPFFALIFCIRILKFILKRGNSASRASESAFRQGYNSGRSYASGFQSASIQTDRELRGGK